MAELQTSHDEVLKQLEASDKPSKEEQKKAFQEAFSNLRRIEVMHGKDSGEYAGALTEYTNLKNKIIVEYNIILSQSEADISNMKDPNSFENKPFSELSLKEAKKALTYLNSRYTSLEKASYTEKLMGKLGNPFPNTIGEVTSKRLANIAQENLIKKIIGEKGFNQELVAGFDTTKGHYLITLSEVETMLKDSSRSITSGSEQAKLNSRVVANYLKYLSEKTGGNVIEFQKLFIQKFGETKAKELVDLWNSGAVTNAKTELAGSGFAKIIENINNIDINNIGENFAGLGLLSPEQITSLGSKVTLAGVDNLLAALKNSDNLVYGGACAATKTMLPTKMDEFRASLQGKSAAENELTTGVDELLKKLRISDEEKALIKAAIIQGLGDVTKSLGTQNQDYTDLPEKISLVLQNAFQKVPSTAGLQIKPGQISSFKELITRIDYVTKSDELQKLNARLDEIQNQKLLLKKQLEAGKISQSQYEEAIKKLDETYSETAALRNEAYIGAKKAQENFNISIDEAKKVTSQLEGTSFTTADVDWFIEDPKVRLPLLYSSNPALNHKKILVEILQKLNAETLRSKGVDFQNIPVDLRYNQEVIQAFDGRITEGDMNSFPAISFFHSNQHGDSINFGFLNTVLDKSSGEGRHIIIGKIFDFPYQQEEGVELLLSLFEYIEKGDLKGSIDIWKDAVPTYILKADKENKLGITSSKLQVAEGIDNKNIQTTLDLLLNQDELNKRLAEEVSVGPTPDILEGGKQLNIKESYIKTIDDYIALHGISQEIEAKFLQLLKLYPVDNFRSLGLLLKKGDSHLVTECIKANISTLSILTPDELGKATTKEAFLSAIKTKYNTADLSRYEIKRYFSFLNFTQPAEYISFLRQLKDISKDYDFTQDADVLGKFAALLTDAKGEIILVDVKDRQLFEEISQQSETKTGINQRIKNIRDTFGKLNETQQSVFLVQMRGVMKKYLPDISPEDTAQLEMMLKDENWFPKYREKIEKLFVNNTPAMLKFLQEIAEIKIAEATSAAEKTGSEEVLSNIPKGYPEIYEYSEAKKGYIMNPKKVEASIMLFAASKKIEPQPGEQFKDFCTRILPLYLQEYTSITPQDKARIQKILGKRAIIRGNMPLVTDPNKALEAARAGTYDQLIYQSLAGDYGNIGIFNNVLPASYLSSLNISTVGSIHTVGDEYYFDTPTQRIELSKQEAELLANNPEAQENLVNAYNTLSSLGMEKFWKKRADIFKAVGASQSSMIFNVSDGDYMSDTEMGRLLRYILKTVDQEPGFEWAKRDMSTYTTKQIVEFIKLKAYNNSLPIHDEYGDTAISKVFFQKFEGQIAGVAQHEIRGRDVADALKR